MKKSKTKELNLVEPIYGTFHIQGSGGATVGSNLSIRNWYLSNALILTCNRKFLSGYTSPEVSVLNSGWCNHYCFEIIKYDMRFTKGYINPIIRALIDEGYYVYFGGADDYYVEGKSWYKERHFSHDGLICGYNQTQKTYSIYAYDKNWIYKKFVTSQKSLNKGWRVMQNQGQYSCIYGIKPKSDIFQFEPEKFLKNLKEYVESTFEDYPLDGEGKVYGIVTQNYIAMYLDKLYDGSISYERMDQRVFRMVWEHKKVMLEAIEKLEIALNLDHKASNAYREIVSQADTMRLMYASHKLRRRDAVLPLIRKKLVAVKENEFYILKNLYEKAKKVIGNDFVEFNKEELAKKSLADN